MKRGKRRSRDGAAWPAALRAAVVSGSLASLASLAVLALRGHAEVGTAPGPVNAPSHWLWGDRALHRDGFSLRYTATGFAVHHLSSMFWGVVHARVFGTGPKSAATALRNALLTTAFAAWVDLQLVPHRLTPGFERRLSPAGLAGVYALFGLGLAAGSIAAARLQSARGRHLIRRWSSTRRRSG